MVLKGKTDKITLAEKSPKVDLRVYVGTKKKPSLNNPNTLIFGDDLVTHFRLEPKIKSLERSLKYLADDNLLTKSLQIVPAFNDPDKFFDCKAQRYSRKGDKLSGLLWECDRETIYKKKEAVNTPEGVRSRFIEANDPCPLQGQPGTCPSGCKETGTLYFYIPELFRRGHNALCSLVLGGEFNILELSARIQSLYDRLGSFEAMGMHETNHSVLFNLTRYSAIRPHPVIVNGKRTGKTTDKLTHLVALDIDPAWMEHWQNMQRVYEVKQLGYRPPAKLIQQCYGVDVIEAEIIADNFAPTALPQQTVRQIAPTWQMDKIKVEELRTLWQQEGWHESALAELLYSYFQISDRSQIMNFSQQEFVQCKKYLSDQTIKQTFLQI